MPLEGKCLSLHEFQGKMPQSKFHSPPKDEASVIHIFVSSVREPFSYRTGVVYL